MADPSKGLYASEAKLPLQERKRSEQQNIRFFWFDGNFYEGRPRVYTQEKVSWVEKEGKRGYLSRLKGPPPCGPQINDLLSSLLLLARPCHHSTSDKLLRNLESGRCGTMM